MRNSLDHLRTHIHTGGGVEKRNTAMPALLAATDSVTLLLCRVTAPPNIHANLWDHAVQARRHSRCVPVIATALFFSLSPVGALSGPRTANCAPPNARRSQLKPTKVGGSGRNILAQNKAAFLWKLTMSRTI